MTDPRTHDAGPDYLWDRSGPPDPEVQRLESALAAFRYKAVPAPDRDAVPAHSAPRVLRTSRRAFVAAAALVLVSLAAWYLVPRDPGSWRVEPLEGRFVLAERPFDESRPLDPGDWLETRADARARIHVPELGRVDVEPGSRIRLLRSGPAPGGTPEHRLDLARGLIDVSVTAPPRVFFVETPFATAVDYGCAYELQTDESGAGTLRVRTGMVKLVRRHTDGRSPESSVYAGMHCRMIPGAGPGTPYREDAPAGFRAQLDALDNLLAGGGPASGGLTPAVAGVLDAAERADAATLWHLLPRVEGDDRERVRARLAALVPPPKGVSADRVMALDPVALDTWWQRIY